MKTITHIVITHAVFLAFFGVATLVLAQTSETEATTPVVSTDESSAETTTAREAKKAEFDTNLEERRTEFEAKREEAKANVEERKEMIADRKTEVEANIEERKAERQERIDERRSQLQARAQERITNLAANVSNRMEAVIARVQNIIDRMDTRITKLSDLGVDTIEAEGALASAQLSIDSALAEISEIDADVASAVGSEDIRSAWISVKEKYSGIRNHLKTAHTELRASVTALKQAVAEAKSDREMSEGAPADSNNEPVSSDE
ncbi:hypothetical protein KC865_03295 [Candidatus Kaiserbacteria bacterium]|nr:hypothetical protein [Candidatus Kaiserbacteria bacterium]USN92490.1 MAG: hypothetical protein H6782_01590 [Candidatus Nomurabacteria bacterium]